MKHSLLITAISLLCFSYSFASQELLTFTCREISQTSANQKPVIAKNGIEVVVKELKNISKTVSFGKHFDYVYSVKVWMYKVKSEQKNLIKSFDSIAKKADVQYQVSALKREGFALNIFLDEEDDSYATLVSSDGSKKDVPLRCTYQAAQ
jgi:hypothetical protein